LNVHNRSIFIEAAPPQVIADEDGLTPVRLILRGKRVTQLWQHTK
jgi:hypothetical protein